MRPIVLTIAGSDPSGGAGVQADLKTIEAEGGYAATVITSITVQNTRGVLACEPLAAKLVTDQLDAVLDDLSVAGIKIGLLPTPELVRAVAERLDRAGPIPIVCDPVLASGHGEALSRPATARYLVEELFPLAELITPNAIEASRLSGVQVEDLATAARAGRRLLERGARAVLVTGGHLEHERGSDLLVEDGGTRLFQGSAIPARHHHGTGCVLSSAIATARARGLCLSESITIARRRVAGALTHGLPLGGGTGPVDPTFTWHSGAASRSEEAR